MERKRDRGHSRRPLHSGSEVIVKREQVFGAAKQVLRLPFSGEDIKSHILSYNSNQHGQSRVNDHAKIPDMIGVRDVSTTDIHWRNRSLIVGRLFL